MENQQFNIPKRKKSKISIELSVFSEGNFSPTELTNYLGIKPTNYWIKGDLYQKESNWSLTIPYLKTFDLDDVSNFLIKKLKGKDDLLADFILKNNLTAIFYVSILIYYPDEPAIHLNKEFIDLVCKLNAEINIDTYIYTRKREK